MLQAGLAAFAGVAVASEGRGAAAAGQGAASGSAQGRLATQSRTLGVHPLGAPFEGWQATLLEVTYPPGVESAAHQHPGPTFGYVVSGRIRWAIDGGAPVVLEAGQSFFEPLGSVHSTSANASGSEPARISVVIIGKPGEPLSRPATRPGE
jgi:quercetin dioxygenase-like cupin family protein